MVLCAALMAMAGQLAARHGDERPVGAVDDLQVADDEAVIEGDGAKALQPIVGVHHQLDADLSDFHGDCLRGGWLCFFRASADYLARVDAIITIPILRARNRAATRRAW